ncbi:MAG: tartrate dehydrogenase [Vicinamibacteria bacterium]|nr:tartrate dehydrogenase [Vicinamibacteria bacterium]
MRSHQIAAIPGDGIGPEVLDAGLAVIEALEKDEGFALNTIRFPWGSEFYLQHGRMVKEGGIESLRGFEAIYFGAVGSKEVPDHISVWDLILPIRQKFDQYVNLRPMRLLPGLTSPLAGRGPKDIDMVCVRENTEGEYSGVGGFVHRGRPGELANEVATFTRAGIERLVQFGFELARTRPRKLVASATKSNALRHSMVLWDEVVEEVAGRFTDITLRRYHVDALAARMVTQPDTVDVIVASNLFGDILTDLGAAISGSLGVAPSGNLDPTRKNPSMFEPIHGSAPDIAGRGIANPIGAVWAGALMLEHLGEKQAAARVVRAIEKVTAEGKVRTPDLGGSATTDDMTNALLEAL